MDKEKKLAALKNRRARLWDFFANPRAIVCDGRSTQRFQELCEINNEIARLEGGVDPAVSDGEAWIRQILSADHDQIIQDFNENTAVEHPSHYTSGGIECIDAMKAMLAGYEQEKIATKFYWHFLSGQVLKYLWRWPLKEHPLQDLKKARWYLDRLIDDIEKQDHAVTELNSDMGKGFSE
jgi:hypothetical protein